MKKHLIYFILFYSSLSFGQQSYFLEGLLGKSKIFLTIVEYKSDNEISATYFYQNALKDINMEGNRKNNSYKFAFKDYNNNHFFEKFELIKQSNGNFKGAWISNSGKKILLQLTPVNFSKFKSNSVASKEHSLNVIKTHFLDFKQDSISTYQGKELVWYSEKHCKSHFFRLGNYFSEKSKSMVNPILNKIHIDNTLAQLNCSSSFDYNSGDAIEYDVSVQYLTTDLIGFKVFSSWFCGGAHPDFGLQGYLLDLNNGKNYSIDEILAFDTSVTTEKKGGFDAFSKYRTDFFAPKLFELINQTEHFVKPTPDSDDNCDYTDLDSWNFVSWNFTEKGIEFTPYFYRAARNCEEPFLVTFEKISSYKNKYFPYNLH